MIDRTRALFLLALLFLSAPLSAVAQSQPQGRSIQGRVRGPDGSSAAWIIIRLLSERSEPTALAVTNNAGEFLFSGLKEAGYLIVVAAPGYQTATEKVNLKERDRNADSARMVEITLTPASNNEQASSAPPVFTQNVPKTARDAFERALKLGKAGRKQVADTLVQEAIRIFPDYFDAHFAMGNELMKAGRLDEAITELEQASRINPKDDRVYQSFGVVLKRQGKYEIAAAIFAEASRLNPIEPLHPLMRAESLIDYGGAIDAAISESASQLRNDAFNEAERNLKVANFKSNNRLAPTVHFQLARLYQKRGERERAAAELEQYLLANPNVRNADEIRDVIRKLRAPTGESLPSPPPPQ